MTPVHSFVQIQPDLCKTMLLKAVFNKRQRTVSDNNFGSREYQRWLTSESVLNRSLNERPPKSNVNNVRDAQRI